MTKPEPSAPLDAKCGATVATYVCTLGRDHVGKHRDESLVLGPCWTDEYKREWEAKRSSSAPLDVGASECRCTAVLLDAVASSHSMTCPLFRCCPAEHVATQHPSLELSAAIPGVPPGTSGPERDAIGALSSDVDRRLDEVRASRDEALTLVIGYRQDLLEARAQVSQLTKQRDEARAAVKAILAVPAIYAAFANRSPESYAALLKIQSWDAAEPAWRADSARLGVTEAEEKK